MVVIHFTERSSLQCTDVPDKEKDHGTVPDDCNDCILRDLLSPRSSWEQGWHVSVVAVTIINKRVSPGWEQALREPWQLQ